MKIETIDDVILDVRNKIIYSLPIILISLIIVIAFSAIALVSNFDSTNNMIIITLILTTVFSGILLLPIIILNNIRSSTVLISQKILHDRIVNESFSELIGSNINEKILNFAKNVLRVDDSIKPPKRNMNSEKLFDVMEILPNGKSFVENLWTPKELIIGKYIPEKIITEDDIIEFYNDVNKSIKKIDKSKTSIKIFLVGDSFNENFSDEDYVSELISKQKCSSHYLTIMKYDESLFELMWLGFCS
mgnify:CR=1 FL=1|tara:strand:- start:1958 stop:2695 length:738 start_codon:yes stop_codon:yes gene_type:complete